MIKVYVDGQSGTTGLEVRERLARLPDVEVLVIDEDKRKDDAERARLLNWADVSFLCLPDDAARAAVAMVQNPDVVIIDASTAHRTAHGWIYGFPELSAQHTALLKEATRITVPGCHATGFTSLVYPLVSAGILSRDVHLTCMSLTGYSGAGKPMIAEYAANGDREDMRSPRMYGLGLSHKHLPEMKHVNGLTHTPTFVPVINPIYRGMTVSIPLGDVGVTREQIRTVYAAHYANQRYVQLMPIDDEATSGGFLPVTLCNGTNDLQIRVLGNDRDILLCATLDNLGKGASGAAIQVMGLRFGIEIV